MLRVGLTGGIGAGKGEVSRRLAMRGGGGRGRANAGGGGGGQGGREVRGGGGVVGGGVAGGIGAGKSEVSKRLAMLGAVVLDADKAAREVVEPGTPGLARIVESFGPGVLKEDGSLDRPK